MQTKELLQKYIKISDFELENARDNAIKIILGNLENFTDYFPSSASKNNFYPRSKNVEWTTGFWTGEIWLAYECTKNPKLKKVGNYQVKSFLNRIEEKIDTDNHDMGFLYSPSCVASYQLTGNETAQKAALLAADNLLERFQEKGEFFQAWGRLGDKDNYRLIIDCLLNMPLLFWASDVTGNPKYADRASRHIRTAMNYVIRPDYSTYHTYFFDVETGQPLRGVTVQGNRDGSAWARGQAWGIYGSALSYKRLRNPEYIETFKKLTDFFLSNLPSNLIPYWDFDFNDGSEEPRDSSASAIAICGILEMAKYMCKDDAEYYVDMAKRLLKALVDHCAVTDNSESNGLLLHGTYARSTENNPCNNSGVDECNTWGDYYYLEALIRLTTDWTSYW